jgi:hypothetical protein
MTDRNCILPPERINVDTYEVLDMDDKHLGEVHAHNFIEAAWAIARGHFGKSTARRVTGWAGANGSFEAFNLNEETTTPFRLRRIP